ncbi:Creatinase [compost metagenome]
MPQTLRIQTGQKIKSTFSAQEYATGQTRLLAHMAAENIPAAIFTSYRINHCSDLASCSFGCGRSFAPFARYHGREADLAWREDIGALLEPRMLLSPEPLSMLPQGLAGVGGYPEHEIPIVN